MAGMRRVSECGLRGDGRRPEEIRKIVGKIGVFKHTQGSAYVEQGDTKVLVAVYGPHGVTSGKGKPLHDQAIVNCQCSMAFLSTSERKMRPRGDRKSIEMTQNLKQTFESAILLNCYPSQQIDIYVEIIQQDANALAASINAASLALADAGVSLKGLVCACSSGSVDDVTLNDLNRLEENRSSFHLTVATLPSVHGQILLHHLNGRLHESQFDKVTDFTVKGCRGVLDAMNEIIQEYVDE